MPPARFLAILCHQIWPSESVIPGITEVPILFLSGLRDEIVPYVFENFLLSTISYACDDCIPSTKYDALLGPD